MVLMHFTHNPTDVLGLSGLRAGPGPTALLRSRLGFRQFHAGDSYSAVEKDPEIRRGQKIRAANVRERSASHWPRCRGRSGFPRTNIAARSKAVALRGWVAGVPRARRERSVKKRSNHRERIELRGEVRAADRADQSFSVRLDDGTRISASFT